MVITAQGTAVHWQSRVHFYWYRKARPAKLQPWPQGSPGTPVVTAFAAWCTPLGSLGTTLECTALAVMEQHARRWLQGIQRV